ncbi:MAG: 50S ribosomal protein L4 [Nitrospirae bacterium]|nr:50S ribosomal protein L4 [Nitrospirota bacterium]
MPTVDVVDLAKRKVGSVELHEGLFGAEPDKPVVHEAVVMQRASARQGTASTLKRGEVSGSGKKPWKQKHTGRARAGSIRSPIWRHGGTVFGPKPRSYAFAMPKKKYRTALQAALSSKLAEGGIMVISELAIAEPKTRLLAKTLGQLGLTAKTLIVLGEGRADLEQAARNLPDVKLVRPEGLNVYDVLRYDSILIPERELRRVQEVWS